MHRKLPSLLICLTIHPDVQRSKADNLRYATLRAKDQAEAIIKAKDIEIKRQNIALEKLADVEKSLDAKVVSCAGALCSQYSEPASDMITRWN